MKNLLDELQQPGPTDKELQRIIHGICTLFFYLDKKRASTQEQREYLESVSFMLQIYENVYAEKTQAIRLIQKMKCEVQSRLAFINCPPNR